MVPMTSSAASETLSARERVAGEAVAARRITSAPPPPGRWTSRSTTSGCRAVTAATASSTSAASARISTVPRAAASSSARTPRRNIAWSSTITTETVLGSAMALLLSGSRQVQPDLGPLTRRRADLARAAVPVHPVHDAVPYAVAVGVDGRRVEAAAAVADEDVDRRVGDLGVDVDLAGARVLGGVGHRLTGGVDDRSQQLVHVAVADRHDLDGHAVLVLDASGGPAQCAADRALVDRLPGVEPRPQVALLGARESRHRRGIVGAALD